MDTNGSTCVVNFKSKSRFPIRRASRVARFPSRAVSFPSRVASFQSRVTSFTSGLTSPSALSIPLVQDINDIYDFEWNSYDCNKNHDTSSSLIASSVTTTLFSLNEIDGPRTMDGGRTIPAATAVMELWRNSLND